MRDDAVELLAAAGVYVARLPDNGPLLIAPRQLTRAIDALREYGWIPDRLDMGPDAVVHLTKPDDHPVTLCIALVRDHRLRVLFPVRTVDVLHRAGWHDRFVNDLSTADELFLACLHFVTSGDRSAIDRVVGAAPAWTETDLLDVAEVVRRAGAQLPVLVALDAAGHALNTPIAPRYRAWRWLALHSRRARRASRRSTFGSIAALVAGAHGSSRRREPTTVDVARTVAMMPSSASHSRWRAMLALPPRQAVTAGRIAASLLRVDRQLRRQPFLDVLDSTGVVVGFGASVRSPMPNLPARTRDDAILVERLGRALLPGNPCLRTSIVIAQRLREFKPVVRVGVAGRDGRFSSAHAWVEVGGVSFGEHDGFAAFVDPAP